MALDKDDTFNLKAVINKQKNKVLFVEIDNGLANVLLGFMTLPLGRIVQLLMNHYGENAPVIGSLNTLYNSVANLDHSHFSSHNKKQRLLDPDSACSSPFRNTKFYGSVPTDCELVLGEPVTGNFIEYSALFIVSDDLRMRDNVSGCFITSLRYIGITTADLVGAETRTVTFGFNEIMDLLKGSFISQHPFTDIILGTRWMNSTLKKSESGYSLHDLVENDSTYDCGGIMLKLMFEKSTKKFLFAQADQHFVDLLFSMLIIPLGLVVSDSATCLDNLDNLHSCISNLWDDVCTNDTVDWLLGNTNPYKNQSLFTSQWVQYLPIYVDWRTRMYIVSDDLTVTPYSVCSTLSLLTQMKTFASDVEQLELNLLLDEVKDSSILKASLTSTCTLTDCFSRILLKRLSKS